MAETWTPISWVNDSGQKLNATNMNRFETGIDQIDVRAATLELGVTTPVPLSASGGVITPNAASGRLFRHDATTNVTLAEPINGSNGQTIEVQVYASGANRNLTVAGSTSTIPSGGSWWGRFTYTASRTEWLLDDSASAGSSGGLDSRVSALEAGVVSVRSYNGSTTLALADGGAAVEVDAASPVTVTVPPNSSVAFPTGTIIEIAQLNTGQVTLNPGAGVTLLTASTLATRARYSAVTIRKRATDTWLVAGDLA